MKSCSTVISKKDNNNVEDCKKSCDNDDNLLGMEIQLERRKVDKECFNGANFERKKTTDILRIN